ncbi:hypothetical protein HDU82_000381 [Entophlyctis luteolus]|nr:hypothetical protein HDU82_000381 [Entophlyctis luteolus]
MYIVSRAYAEKYPYAFDEWVVVFNDSEAVCASIMFGLLLYSTINLSYIMSRIPFMLLQTPFRPQFQRPYFATSLKDFWYRWNVNIQTALRECVYEPVVTYTAQHTALSRPRQHAFAAFTAFLASALFHEYYTVWAMPAETLGRNMVFFILNWCLVGAQIKFEKRTGFGRTWGTGRVWKLAGWLATFAILLFTCPPFARPYARAGVLLTIPMPEGALAFAKEWI